MLTIEEKYPLSPYNSKAFGRYFGGLKIGVMDIETTGLSPKYSKLILGGLLIFGAKEEADIFQVFAESPYEEQQLLEAYTAKLQTLDLVITYNGTSFDLPFLKERLRQNEDFESERKLPHNFDLYMVLYGHSSFKRFLPNLKQKTVEEFMGLKTEREDEISGRESVVLYNKYLSLSRDTEQISFEALPVKSPKEEFLEKILLHNRDDLLQLARLLPILEKTDLHKAMFFMGYPVESLCVNKIRIAGKTLCISGIQIKEPLDYIAYESPEQPSNLFFSREEKTFEVVLPLSVKGELICLDLEELFSKGPEELEILSRYPACASGFLAIKNGNKIYHQELNHFAILYLNKALENIRK